MSRRLTGGFFSLFDRKNQRLAALFSGVILVGVMLILPSPKRRIVESKEIVEAVFFGLTVPPWAFMVLCALGFGLLYFAFLKLLDAFWPDQPKYEVVRVEKLFEREDGGFIGWKPEVPGTPSPMEYTPPNFFTDTTATEFLTARPPNMMRTLLGVDAMKEYWDFEELQEKWLQTAPEATLQDLLPAAETLLQECPGDRDVIAALCAAMEQRGILSKPEVRAFAERLGDSALLEALGE